MKAAIYLRVSTDRQAEEGFSMEAQHDILMNLLEKKNIDLYRVYSDPGISAKTMKKRPGIQALIADMKAGRFDTVVVHKLDRLSRNQGDLYEFIALINKLDIRLIIAAQGDEEIDTRSPMGKAFLMFSGIWAEIYVDNLREETLKGLTKKMNKGGRHMSRAPLGYDFDDNRNLVINEQEAKLVREVFAKYLEGKGVVWIAKYMNSFSRGKEGGVWDQKYVRIILQNPTYTGHNHFKPDHWEEEKRIIVNGDHEAIISQKDFDRVQAMMSRRSNGQMSKTSHEYPYGGIVRCGKCGATYIGNATKQKLASGEYRTYRSYRCRNHYTNNTCDAPGIQEGKLNTLVFEKLMLAGDKIQDRKDKNKQKDKRHLQKEIEVSNRRRKNWMMALGDGKLSPEDYANLIEEEEQRIKEIAAEFEDQEDLYINELSPDVLKEMMLMLKENWDFMDVEYQKQLIQSMFRKIVIKKESNVWTISEILTV
ncbi:resolvase, partial [Mucor ambiguus]